jgi:glycosyltransferase involved in cell wall biosynthesis
LLKTEPERKPFFSIGVPTYNRHDLLRDTLNSVLSQGFTDFEIIVGNDYQAEVLICEMLEITDPRIRIVNYPHNLREVGNMNALLERASGRYFTWLFDDDLYEPDFLQTAHDCLEKTGFPPALFTSFRMMKVQETFQPQKLHAGTTLEFTGREFLRWYSVDRPQTASTFGLFDIEKLRSIVGNVESLSPSAIGLYSEFHYLLKCALFDRIVYLDAPFYVFRRHAESYSESNLDLENHLIAGRELIRRSAEVLRHLTLVGDFPTNLQKICLIHIITFAYKTARIEFARSRFGVDIMFRAFSRHWNEFQNTRKRYIDQGGAVGFKNSFLFYRTLLHSQYLMLRLLIHFQTMSRG